MKSSLDWGSQMPGQILLNAACFTQDEALGCLFKKHYDCQIILKKPKLY